MTTGDAGLLTPLILHTGTETRADTGKHRADICEGYYSFPEGQHMVFYLIGPHSIDIIGIPHKEMDIISYFPQI